MMLLLFVALVWLGIATLTRRNKFLSDQVIGVLALGGASVILWGWAFSGPDTPGPAASGGPRTAASTIGPNMPDLDANRQPAEPGLGPGMTSPAIAAASNPSTDGTNFAPATSTYPSATSSPASFTADFHKYVAEAWLPPAELPFAAEFSWQGNGQTPLGSTGVIQQDWYTCNPTGKEWGYDPAKDGVQAVNFTAPPGNPQAQLEERMIFFADSQAASHALDQITADFTACKTVTALPGFGMEGIELVRLNKTATIDGGFAYLHTARKFDGTRGTGVGHWGTDAHEYFVQRGNILVIISLFAQGAAGGNAMDATTTDSTILQQAAAHLVAAYGG